MINNNNNRETYSKKIKNYNNSCNLHPVLPSNYSNHNRKKINNMSNCLFSFMKKDLLFSIYTGIIVPSLMKKLLVLYTIWKFY